MGILTNLINQLGSELFHFGFGQLDDYVTREIQEGRDANAFKALNEYEDFITNRLTQGNQQAGILPVNNDPNMQMQIPQSMGISAAPTGPLDLVGDENIMSRINKSNLAQQMAFQKYNQALQYDPYYVQQEIQRKAQENRLGLVKDLTGEGYKQNQMGFQEALGAYDQPDKYDLTREERLRRLQEKQRGQTTAQYEAAQPYKDMAKQKQAVARGTVTQPVQVQRQPSEQIFSSVTSQDISRMEKILMNSNEFTTAIPGKFGQPPQKSLNEQGNQVLSLAADKLQRQRKKNPILAVKQAMDETRKNQQEQGNIMSQMPPKPTALQNLPRPQPTTTPKTTPLPTALPNVAPVPQPTQSPTQTMTAPTALSTIQKIAAARAKGISDDQIRKALEADGLNPKDYGL